MSPHQKPSSYRNEDLLMGARLVHCVCCGVWNHTQAAHIGTVADGKGRGIKVSDSQIAALCTVHQDNRNRLVAGCHEQFDQYKIDQARGYEFIAKTYIAMIEMGILKVDKKVLRDLIAERSA